MQARRLIAPVILSTVLGPAALACAFHNYAPGEGLIDRLLASEHIVLVRPDPDDAGRYIAVEALEGGLADVVIPAVPDPETRARLLANPDHAVLFAREESYGPWAELAYLGPEFRAVIGTVMARLPQWELGDDLGRYAMFAGLIGHVDPAIAEAALREVDQADYGVLRQLPLAGNAEMILAAIDDPAGDDLRPIRILLLGLSGDDRAADYLRPAFTRALMTDGAILGAYATALMELGGPDAADTIAREVLLDAKLPVETRELVVEAFALQSQSGAMETGQAVRAAIDSVLVQAPELAGAVARQFGMRGDFSQNERLAGMMNEKRVTAIADMLAVGQYVMFAQEEN